MAGLNLERAIKEGYKKMRSSRYTLYGTQMLELGKRNAIDAICDSFAFGYNQGYKAAKAEMRKSS